MAPGAFSLSPMKFRILTTVLALAVCSGCFKDDKKAAKKRGDDKYQTDKPPVPTKDQSADMTFQSFVGHLKIAVQRRDTAMLSSMMAPNFGYRWDNAPEGEDPFTYWDKNNLWPELAALMNERWVPYDGFMVVPAQLSIDTEYRGYRAGVQQFNGSWRFAYFVSAPPNE